MQKVLVCLGFLGLAPLAGRALATLPDNPIAVGHCTATVKVDVARMRSGPSLQARILGVKVQDESLFVTKVVGKWVQVVPAEGDTAYVAAYLLAFPPNVILEQWKRGAPPARVGKKAKVKWAVNFRKYPSAQSPQLGHFNPRDEVAVLTDLGNGWSLVQSRTADGNGNCFGFVANRALAAPDVPDPAEWSTPLAQVTPIPGDRLDTEPKVESPAAYCSRTAWSPELFVLELKEGRNAPPSFGNSPTGDLLALAR